MQLPFRPASTTRSPTFLIFALPLLFLFTGLVLRFLAMRTITPDAQMSDFADTICRWDCSWYITLAQTGYDVFPIPSRINAGNWAFFPLYPLFVGAIVKLLPFATIVTATGVSLVTAYVACIAAWPLFNKNLRAYTLYAAYLLSGPFSFYFTSFFTEVLFVLLTTLVFVALRHSNYIAAGMATALLSATRIVGVFATLSIVLQASMDHRAATGSWRGLLPALLKRPNLLLGVFIAPLGLFAYSAFLNAHVGDGLAFQHTQRAWGRPFGNPLFFVWQGLTSWPSTGFIPTPSQILALAAVTGVVLAGVLACRGRWPEALFAAVALILPLFAGLASVVRFTAAMAPLSILVMGLLASRRWLFWLSLAALLALGYFVTLAWLGGNVSLV